MAKLGISTGTNPNDGSGDSLLAGAVKINSNFNEVYAAIGNGSTVSTPVTSITAGDNIIVSGSTGSVTITGIGTADIDTDRINVSGVVTASSFSGSGVNLTNLPSSALVGTLPAVSGANLTGIVTFIDAGANITVTTGPTGVTTIASSSGSATTSNVSSNTLVVSGVSTFSGSVSFASTDTAVSFASSVTFGDNDKIYLGDDDDVEIYWDSSSGRGILDSSGGWDMYGQLIYLYYYNNSADTITERLQVNSRGITITGDSNIITGGLQVTGVSTFNSNTNITGNLNVGTGASIAGISTFTADKVFFKNGGGTPATLQVETGAGGIGNTIRSSSSLDLATNGSAFNLYLDTDTAIIAGGTGVSQYTSLYGQGSEKLKTVGSGVTVTGTTFTNELNVSTNVNVTGVSTFVGNARFHEDINVGTPGTAQQDNIFCYDQTFLYFGDSNDFHIMHDGTDAITKMREDGGRLRISANPLEFQISDVSVATITGAGMTVGGDIAMYTNSGIVSATSYTGDGSELADGKWTLGANGTSDYTFTGIGLTQTTNDPILYLARGRVYEFVNSMGAHPFEIRQSAGGSAYNSGVTNNAVSSGTLRFEIPFDAPNTLYYQCTSHAGMGSTIVVYPNTI